MLLSPYDQHWVDWALRHQRQTPSPETELEEPAAPVVIVRRQATSEPPPTEKKKST